MTREQALINALAQQRQAGFDAAANLAADLAVAQERIAELEAELVNLKPQPVEG